MHNYLKERLGMALGVEHLTCAYTFVARCTHNVHMDMDIV